MILAAANFVYDETILESIRRSLINGQQTLAVAESVTAGHLQAALSLAQEASLFFHGGITAYNLGQKARHLHVNPIHATSCNSVSQFVADDMAVNANRLFSSDWAIGVTGYATKVPEMGINDLFCFFSIAFKREVLRQGRIRCEERPPLEVQVFYANRLLAELSQCLNEAGNHPPTRLASVARQS